MKIITACLLLAHASLTLSAEEPVGLPLRRKTEDESAALAFLTPQHIELGEIACYGHITREFRLRNNGTRDIKINRIVSTCGCLQGQISTNLVAPDAELVVVAKLNAAQVHDTFRRGLWLNLADSELKPINLTVNGTVRPIFSGFPQDPHELFNLRPGHTSTNIFTFVATEKGIALDTPNVLCSEQVSLEYSMITNVAELTSYTLTTRFTVKEMSAGQIASLSFPVTGTSEPVQPMTLRIKAANAKALDITPDYIGLDMDKKEAQMFRLIAKHRREAMIHEMLTWDPLPEGIQIRTSTSGRRRTMVNVMVTVKPEITADMLKSGVPQKIVFHYPRHGDTEVTLGPADLATQTPQAANRRPMRLFVVDQEDSAPQPPAAP